MRTAGDWASFADGGIRPRHATAGAGARRSEAEAYEPCFSRTFSAFLIATFSLR